MCNYRSCFLNFIKLFPVYFARRQAISYSRFYSENVLWRLAFIAVCIRQSLPCTRTTLLRTRTTLLRSLCLQDNRFSVPANLPAIISGISTPSRTRTYNLRFWRPAFCQLKLLTYSAATGLEPVPCPVEPRSYQEVCYPYITTANLVLPLILHFIQGLYCLQFLRLKLSANIFMLTLGGTALPCQA